MFLNTVFRKFTKWT